MSKLNDLLVKVRPLISATALEDAAGIPKNTLGKHYRWVDGKANGQAISDKHAPNIVRALCSVFGMIKIGNNVIVASFEDPAIIIIRPTGELEDIEVTAENGSSYFLYKEEQSRDVYDDFDFEQFFKQKTSMAKVLKIKMQGKINDPIYLSTSTDFEGPLSDCLDDLKRSRKSWASQHTVHEWGEQGFLVESNSGRAMFGYTIEKSV